MVATAPDVVDAPADPTAKVPAVHATKGRRYRVLDGDEGDVCLVQLIGDGHKTFPAGTLLPVPNVPRFETASEAEKWVGNDSGDLLHGKQIMCFQAKRIWNIQVENKPIVKITEKPRRQVSGPKPE